MQVTEIKSSDAIQLNVEGKVDTTTAPQLQQAILTAFQKTKNVILNLEAVAYMSSAGLRALLLGTKTAASKGGSMKLIHVQDSVMQVFEVTGFKSILTIE